MWEGRVPFSTVEAPSLGVTQERPLIVDHWKTPVFVSFHDASSNVGIQIK